MTEVQERMLLLMDEIKDICVKESLRYVLGKKTAVTAFKFGKFIDNMSSAILFMPLSDIYKLKAYIDKNCADSRIIECWDNNAELKRMKFRYVDKGSLLYDGQNVEHVKCLGINVLILPIMEKKVSKKVKGCENYIIALNNNNNPRLLKIIAKEIYYKIFSFSFMSKLFHTNIVKNPNEVGIHYGALKSITKSKEAIIKYIKDNLTLKDNEKPSHYWLRNPKGYMIDCPMDLFDNTQEVELEGHKYLIYAKAEEYFKGFYGGKLGGDINLQNAGQDDCDDIIDCPDRITLIVECDLPYDEYLDYIKEKGPSISEIADNKKKYNDFMSKYYIPMEKKYMKKYYEIKRCVERIDVWSRLKSKRGELKEAYDKKDISKLEVLLKEYLKKTDFYLNKGVAFYIDDEIFKYARLVWESENRPIRKKADGQVITFADNIYNRVPELYKNETVDQYFETRNNS